MDVLEFDQDPCVILKVEPLTSWYKEVNEIKNNPIIVQILISCICYAPNPIQTQYKLYGFPFRFPVHPDNPDQNILCWKSAKKLLERDHASSKIIENFKCDFNGDQIDLNQKIYGNFCLGCSRCLSPETGKCNYPYSASPPIYILFCLVDVVRGTIVSNYFLACELVLSKLSNLYKKFYNRHRYESGQLFFEDNRINIDEIVNQQVALPKFVDEIVNQQVSFYDFKKIHDEIQEYIEQIVKFEQELSNKIYDIKSRLTEENNSDEYARQWLSLKIQGASNDLDLLGSQLGFLQKILLHFYSFPTEFKEFVNIDTLITTFYGCINWYRSFKEDDLLLGYVH